MCGRRDRQIDVERVVNRVQTSPMEVEDSTAGKVERVCPQKREQALSFYLQSWLLCVCGTQH